MENSPGNIRPAYKLPSHSSRAQILSPVTIIARLVSLLTISQQDDKSDSNSVEPSSSPNERYWLTIWEVKTNAMSSSCTQLHPSISPVHSGNLSNEGRIPATEPPPHAFIVSSFMLPVDLLSSSHPRSAVNSLSRTS